MKTTLSGGLFLAASAAAALDRDREARLVFAFQEKCIAEAREVIRKMDAKSKNAATKRLRGFVPLMKEVNAMSLISPDSERVVKDYCLQKPSQ